LTSTFTILCPQGIVMAADSAATERHPITKRARYWKQDFGKYKEFIKK